MEFSHNSPFKNESVPHGRPNVMYMMPTLYGTEDCLATVDDHELNVCKSETSFRISLSCDEDIFYLCIHLMSEKGLQVPKDAFKAYDLFLELRGSILTMMA